MVALGWRRRSLASFPFGQVWDRGGQSVIVHYGAVRIDGEPTERIGLAVAIVDPARISFTRLVRPAVATVGTVRPPPPGLEPSTAPVDALSAAIALAGIPLSPGDLQLTFGVRDGRPTWLVAVPHTCFDAVEAAICGSVTVHVVVDDQTGGVSTWDVELEDVSGS
jgi:hypothetical protein